ncbi:hypothetical protein F2Q68_00030879 [Brassica cretica]|uniref:Uncharacterized protein n=1 Tax=Brassica cretica TaxID=69181 RepID=A0A8S9GDS0_BRACR|nr:hypothetical protein F2Q68_00030879 [Brassica cretica]KAF3503976.1 hypothetical protein F2Q69_00043426 [Brassica cretica]
MSDIPLYRPHFLAYMKVQALPWEYRSHDARIFKQVSGSAGTDGWIEVHHTRDGKLVIQHRVLKAVEVLVSQDNERGGEFLLESSRVFF